MTTWVFSEEIDGHASASALELLTKARTFGDTAVFHIGAGSEAAYAELGSHGATKVYHLATGDRLPSAAAAAALAVLAEEHSADLIMFGMGNTDRDVAGRLSAKLGRPVLGSAVDVTIDGAVRVTSEILGGAQAVVTESTGAAPTLVLVRPKAFPAEPSTDGVPEVTQVPMPDVGHAGSAVITESHVEESEGPDLEVAGIVVAGGRGVGSAEKWAVVEDLASQLDAAVGATRAVIDAGWVPARLQIGQTGKTVKPDVYIAAGVSGAMQHLVGMKDAGTIIAINKDAEAPIFAVADLGIVGDLHSVVPKLVEALRTR
ncbi:MAG: electron transfer flavoprotein subunit alpha/FixB family protein [Actinomycetota bacterium]|nr:electron transfer flavoprotein subunit alpha/FixB family protein [Actinomycetota bacterium]